MCIRDSWDIDKGKITLGGMDISSVDPETLLGSFSIAVSYTHLDVYKRQVITAELDDSPLAGEMSGFLGELCLLYTSRGRVRIHLYQKEMSIRQADLLQYYLCALPGVKDAKVYERTADAVVVFEGDRGEILNGVRKFSYENERLQELVPKNSGRALNREYKDCLLYTSRCV